MMNGVSNLCGSFQRLVTQTASATGLEFFRILTEELARALDFKFALVSELTDMRLERARTLAFYATNGHSEGFEYGLGGTPCQGASEGRLCFYGSDVARIFPEDRPLRDMGAEAYIGAPLLDAAGKPIGILAALDDKPRTQTEELQTVFTIFAARAGLELERMRIQTMLEGSEQRFRGLLESGSDLILALDRDGKIRYASPSCARVSGFEPAEVINKSAFDFVAPKDRAALLDLFCRALQRPEPGPLFETQIHRKDGTWIDVESRANQIYFDPHNPGLVLNCRDISDRKQAERRLRFKNALLETQSECSPDGTLVVAHDGEVLHWNHRFGELWQIHDEEFGRGADGVWSHVQDQLTDAKKFSQMVEDLHLDVTETRRETMITRDCRTIEVYSAPVRQSSGVCFGRLWNCRDMTEQVRLRERLLHSQRIETIGEISAGVAHEFKNVLVPILGSAELASMDLPESHPGQKWLKQIIKSAHCARDLVQQILTFGRETCSTRSPISLADVVNGALRMLRAAVPKTVEIRREVAANLPVVMADAGQISQIIMNLGINAWQAMQHRGGTIHCSLDLAAGPDAEFPELPFGQFVRLKLTDTGKGMAPDVAARVFEPFFTTKPPGEGTGLGLSVVHGIVKSHNGFINVTSSPGSGTTFTIFFPAVTNNS